MTGSVALATCRERGGQDRGDELLVPVLADLGLRAESILWDEPRDWSEFDLVVVRSARDYAARRAEFVQWAGSVPQLLNPGPVLIWNSDKHYLVDLEKAGIPVVPTTWLEPGQNLGPRGLHTRFPALGDFVIKPAISAGTADTGRYTSADAYSRGLAIRHAHRLVEAGRTAMVQRYVRSVDTEGELALFFIDGTFSHAMHKSAMLSGSDVAPDAGLHVETVRPARVDERELAAAQRVLAAVGDLFGTGMSNPLLYARVDLIAGEDGEPLLLELELTKSTMFVDQVPGAVERLARAIAARVVDRIG